MEHRWSGWPGAWCLDCGTEDPREICLADGHGIAPAWVWRLCGWLADFGYRGTERLRRWLMHRYDCRRPECQETDCTEPNSHRNDPYWHAHEDPDAFGPPSDF